MNIKPTRSELQKLKQRIKLAKSGYNLLKKKRDGLILEFFIILKEARSMREKLMNLYKEAAKKMNIARVIESDIKLQSMALAVQKKPSITIQTKNIMGVIVPKIQGSIVKKHFLERGFGNISSSAIIDEAVSGYEIVIDTVVKFAESETTLKRLLIEIEKTKRRVNALEFEIIPRLNKQKAFITMRLEEIERENIFRMKRIKSK